jgi:carboxyl-terminal processing protease
MRLLKILLVVLICLAAAGAAFSAGYATHLVLSEAAGHNGQPAKRTLIAEPNQPTTEEALAFKVFWEAWSLVKQNFLGQLPNAHQMTYGAIRGMLAELKDPHTLFEEPRQRQLEKDEHRGRFGGIGVWIYLREADRQFVLTPIENGPAARAGVRDGDVLLRVDDTVVDATKMTREDVVALVRGPVGERVRISVRRAGEADPRTMEIVREEFQTPSVEWRMLDDRAPNVGYLHITLFTERTDAELQQAVAELRRRGAARLVLDLRDNPGGLLDSAVAVASEFLSDGTVMYERKRDGSERAYPVIKGGVALDLPLVVLVNGGSASASEIVAGALQDLGRCTVVGERSYGKGSVQLVFDLSDGSSVHITVARWLTPARREIDGAGIQPNDIVAVAQEDRDKGRDPQLTAAVARLIAMSK